MYQESLKISNRIITAEDLQEIFSFMNDTLNKWLKVYKQEERQNRPIEWLYQKWTFNDANSKLSFDVSFSDNTSISFDNYGSFIGVFNNRIKEITKITAYFFLYYSTQDGENKKSYFQKIAMYVYENEISVDVDLSSEDRKLNEVYELIKNKINNAPIKYDNVIKKRKSIHTISAFALGYIPAMVIGIATLFMTAVRDILSDTYVLFPLLVSVVAYFIGEMLASNRFNKYYDELIPNKKYVGYDSDKGTSIYEDDIDAYTSENEILIGKNADNMKKRNEITTKYTKYKKLIPYEIIALLILSIIVIFL